MENSRSGNEQVAPDLEEILSFGEAVSEVQQRWAERIDPDVGVSDKEVRQRMAGGVPALDGEVLAVAPEAFRGLTAEMIQVFWNGDRAAETVEKLLADEALAPENIPTFVARLTRDQKRCLSGLGSRTELSGEALSALFQMVLIPFYQKAAGSLRESVGDSGWRRGFCPVCGAWPQMARLPDANSPRVLFCALCRTEWAFPRLQCPFCGAGQKHLRYFRVEGDRGYRVDVCEACRHYIKTCCNQTASLPLADLLTYDLDLLAAQEGYVSASEV